MQLLRGDHYNESSIWRERLRGRVVRQLTNSGHFSQGPTYHFGAGWIPQTNQFLMIHADADQRRLCAADPVTGELTVLATIAGHAEVVETAGRDSWYPNATALCHGSHEQVLLASRQKLWMSDSIIGTQEPRLLYEVGENFQLGEPASSIDGKHVFIWRNPKPPVALPAPDVFAAMAGRDDMGVHFVGLIVLPAPLMNFSRIPLGAVIMCNLVPLTRI